MKQKRIISIFVIISLLFGIGSIAYAEPTEDLHTGPLPGETVDGRSPGPKVEEYYNYKDDKVYKPGSLLSDVDFSTVGKGLFYDGNDFYFFIDTGIMATNFMYNIEGDRFFFGEDGKMIKDELISYNDELYYFDMNGAMYKNRWYSDESIDESDGTIHYTDYYFGPTGRAYRAGANVGLIVKTIEGERFGFNSDGEKLEGYYDQNGVEQDPEEVAAYEDCVYYFDPEENGAACKGWHYYEGSVRGDEYDDNEEIVLYFDDKTCRKVAARVSASDTERAVSRIIDGQRYAFDSNGVRKNSWYSNEPGRASQSNLKYFNEEYDGYLQKGWILAVPGAYSQHGEDLILDVNKKRHNDEEERWFYAGSNGNILKKTIRKIGAYTYAFDDDGVMQEDAFVRVRYGNFLKAYQAEELTRANILVDPEESGGNADPDPDGPENPVSLDGTKGILRANQGEQWMYFSDGDTDEAEDSKLGAQCKLNAQVKIALKDRDIFFMANTTGGYTYYDANAGTNGITTIVERSGKYIQNGVILKPDPEDNNYGIVRRYPSPQMSGSDENPTVILNYKNQFITIAPTDGYFYFEVVDGKGQPMKTEYKSYKDKQGSYLYVGPSAQFIGYYPYEGKYYSKTPGNLKDAEGNSIPASDQPCWAYRDTSEKRWIYGLPPESERLEPSSLYLNFNSSSSLGESDTFGPYTEGFASLIYTEP